MSNGNTITTILAVVGGARLALHALSAAERAYLTHRIGIEYTTFRTTRKNDRDRRTLRDARRLADMCDRHGLTGTAALYYWLVDTVQKLDNNTEQADLEEAMRRFQDLQEQVNRDRL